MRLCLDWISLPTYPGPFTLTTHFTRKDYPSLNRWWRVTCLHLFSPAGASYLIHLFIFLLGWPVFAGGGVLPSQLIIIFPFYPLPLPSPVEIIKCLTFTPLTSTTLSWSDRVDALRGSGQLPGERESSYVIFISWVLRIQQFSLHFTHKVLLKWNNHISLGGKWRQW